LSRAERGRFGRGRQELTRLDAVVIMKKPSPNGDGLRGIAAIRRLATPLRKGVRLVGKKQLYFVLRFLVCLAFALYILTIEAC